MITHRRIELATEWTDPEFHSNVPAALYLRVIEIPMPRRWVSDLQLSNKANLIPDGVQATIQERGWSSPIWYTPSRHM
jgi:hypothetical protein